MSDAVEAEPVAGDAGTAARTDDDPPASADSVGADERPSGADDADGTVERVHVDEGTVREGAGRWEQRSTDRWEVGFAVAFVAGAAGLLANSTALFVSAAIGVAFAAYGYATRSPPLSVGVVRRLSETSPLPGDEIRVTVTLVNEGSTAIPDLRVVDGVPETLAVVSGTPRHATSLQPGEEASFTYRLRARRGDHDFGETVLIARNVSGAAEKRAAVPTGTDVSCDAVVEGVALPSQTIPYTGRIPTDVGGEGVEFYQTREFHPADPINRVDWKRYARTRELTTVEFREERAATVVVIVDGRQKARVARDSQAPTAVEFGVYAALRLVETLLGDGNVVGVGWDGRRQDYLSPGAGSDQAVRTRRFLLDHLDAAESHGPTGSAPPDTDRTFFAGLADGVADAGRTDRGPSVDASPYSRPPLTDGGAIDELHRRLPDDAQVVFLSGLTDDRPAATARHFVAHGHATTVVSPNVTGTATPGGTIARIERGTRIRDLRADGVRVVDWAPEEPLHVALERAGRRWSA